MCVHVPYLMYGSTDSHTALASISAMTNKTIVVSCMHSSLSYEAFLIKPTSLCKQELFLHIFNYVAS